jgi:hypothetical protein
MVIWLQSDESAVVSNEDANRMSLFYAHPTPMLRALSDATSRFVSEVCSIWILLIDKDCNEQFVFSFAEKL